MDVPLRVPLHFRGLLAKILGPEEVCVLLALGPG